jgi:cyclopropane-fatty-acyl-phospholipid synthase
MQYSCAYFTDPGETLEQAQRNKLRLIAAKLRLAPGLKVLDIGSGGATSRSTSPPWRTWTSPA